MKSKSRKWLPTLGELIDRLSIHQLKEVFIPENKDNYAKEMKDMVHDIELILKEKGGKRERVKLMVNSSEQL
jgi:hypothetical protein